MAANDDRFIPTIKPATRQPERKPNEPVPAVIPSIESLNEEIRRLWEYVYYLEGRSGAVTIRDDLRSLTKVSGGSTQVPDAPLQGTTTTTGAQGVFSGFGTPGDITLRRAGGSDGAPVVTTVSTLGEIDFQGHDGSNYVTSAVIRSDSEGGITTGFVPGNIRIYHNNSTNVLTLHAEFLAGGSITMNSRVALPTAATFGFLYIPSMAGAPSGAGEAGLGLPIVFDTTNGKLWAYYAAAWHFVLFT